MTEGYLRVADRRRERMTAATRTRHATELLRQSIASIESDDWDLPDLTRPGRYMVNPMDSASFQNHILSLNILESLEGRPIGGLPSHLINLLPTMPYKDSKEAQKEERCPICLDDYEQADVVMGISECGHFFHKDCFHPWLKTSRTCPYCRQRINPKRPSGSGGKRDGGAPPPPPASGSGSGGGDGPRSHRRTMFAPFTSRRD